jgi:hypothetical protein
MSPEACCSSHSFILKRQASSISLGGRAKTDANSFMAPSASNIEASPTLEIQSLTLT